MIERELFETWKESEATQQVFKILIDFNQQMMNTWAQGNFSPERAEKASIQCQANLDLVNLDYDTIKELYGVNE